MTADFTLGDYELDDDSNGDLVIKDASDTIVMRWDETNSEWNLENQSLANINSLSTDQGTITSLDGTDLQYESANTTYEQNGRIHVNAGDPAGILSGNNIAEKIDNAITYLTNNFKGKGRVIVPQPADGSEYSAGTSRITFDRPSGNRLPEIVGRGMVRIAWSDQLSNAPIHLPAGTTNARYGALRNLSLRFKGTGSVPKLIDLNDPYMFEIETCRLVASGVVSDASLQISSPQGGGAPYCNIRNSVFKGGPPTAIRLGVNGGNPVNSCEIQNVAANGTRAIEIFGNDNQIHPSTDISGSSDAGIFIDGNRNVVKSRFEGGFGSGGNVVTPIETTATAEENRLAPTSPEAERYCIIRGVRNRFVNSPVRNLVVEEHGGGDDLTKSPKWALAGAALQDYRFNSLINRTNGNGSETGTVDFGGFGIGDTSHRPWWHAEVVLADDTQVRYEMGFWFDSNNYLLFIYDAGSSATTITAETKEGGSVNSSTDTGVAPDTTHGNLFAIHCEDDGLTIRYLIDGDDVAQHSLSGKTGFEPRFYAEEKEAVQKKQEVFSLEIEAEETTRSNPL